MTTNQVSRHGFLESDIADLTTWYEGYYGVPYAIKDVQKPSLPYNPVGHDGKNVLPDSYVKPMRVLYTRAKAAAIMVDGYQSLIAPYREAGYLSLKEVVQLSGWVAHRVKHLQKIGRLVVVDVTGGKYGNRERYFIHPDIAEAFVAWAKGGAA